MKMGYKPTPCIYWRSYGVSSFGGCAAPSRQRKGILKLLLGEQPSCIFTKETLESWTNCPAYKEFPPPTPPVALPAPSARRRQTPRQATDSFAPDARFLKKLQLA